MKSSALPAISFGEAFWVWVRVALLSFGGPAAQIAVMHRILVEEKRWISEARFLHALNYCMVLPGPEAQQLATYIGWLLHRTPGGLIAGGLFVLPGFLSILLLSILYVSFQGSGGVEALFFGLKPAVMAIVLEAVLRVGRRALKNRVMQGIAGGAFLAIFFFNVPFPLIVLGAGLLGFAGGRGGLSSFEVMQGHGKGDEEESELALPAVRPSLRRALRVAGTGLFVWWAPLGALALWLGRDHTLVQVGLFFSQSAMVTFGGAYAVLAYVAQEAVATYGWLQPGEMLDGLGMAETTPGPLIQVVQFVGFMGAFRHPGTLPPLMAGVLGSLVSAWATFAPCFLWIFLGAPYIEALRGNRLLTTALSAITAAVVGVILNLAIWFSLHTLFGTVTERFLGPLRLYVPHLATLDLAALGIAVVAFIALFQLKLGMAAVLGLSVLLSVLVFLLR